MKKLILTAVLSSLATLVGVFGIAGAELPKKVKLENPKVRVSEVTYQPGVPRPRYIRPTDQIIVFMDDCKYRRTDSGTGEKTVRERNWHDQGQDVIMQQTYKTTDLAPDERMAVERLVCRPLQSDEAVEVLV